MINEFDTTTITKTARIGFLLVCIEKIKYHFSDRPQTTALIEKLISEVWSWLDRRQPSCSAIYWENNPKLMEQELLYHDEPVLLTAFHAVLDMHYYTIQKIHVIEYFESGGIEPSVGSDVYDVDEDYFFNCVNRCIEASKDPDATQVWAETTIARLQQEHAPADKEDNGRSVSRDYFVPIS